LHAYALAEVCMNGFLSVSEESRAELVNLVLELMFDRFKHSARILTM